jgi:hypothetical protein
MVHHLVGTLQVGQEYWLCEWPTVQYEHHASVDDGLHLSDRHHTGDLLHQLYTVHSWPHTSTGTEFRPPVVGTSR